MTPEYSKAEGHITAISQKEKGFGFHIEGSDYTGWINGKGTCPVRKGETINVEYSEDTTDGKTWRNYISHNVVGEAEPKKESNHWDNERKYKNRISALQVAVQMKAEGASLSLMLNDAEDIEKWIVRD